MTSSGSVTAWGENVSGILGDGTTTDRHAPVPVVGPANIIMLAAGDDHSLALTSDGKLWAWGYDNYGQLADGSTSNRSTTIIVPITGVRAMAASDNRTLLVKADGTVWGWGTNNLGQLGNGGTATTYGQGVQMSGISAASKVASGNSHTLVLQADGTVGACGDNTYGQLGDGTTTQRLTPVQVPGLAGVVAIAVGYAQSYALKSDGSVWAWGYNYYGQIGDGTTTNRTSPVQVGGLTNVVAVAAGNLSNLALKQDGTVWAWGNNQYGQLGDGTTTSRATPVQVSGLSNVLAIAAGGGHSLAVLSDWTVRAWGRNDYGQLGDGTTIQRLTPVTPLGDVIAPTPPTNLQASNYTTASFTLSWSPSIDDMAVTDYEVFKNGLSIGTTTGLSMNVGDIVPAAAYVMTVRARDAAGNFSSLSAPLTVLADSIPPSAPSSLNYAEETATTVTLVWGPSTDNATVTGYNIYRNGALLGTTSESVYTDSGLTPSTAYSYTVKALDEAGNLSPASNTLNLTTSADFSADSDHDGIPDTLETALGTNGSSAATPDSGIQQNIHRPQSDQP